MTEGPAPISHPTRQPPRARLPSEELRRVPGRRPCGPPINSVVCEVLCADFYEHVYVYIYIYIYM